MQVPLTKQKEERRRPKVAPPPVSCGRCDRSPSPSRRRCSRSGSPSTQRRDRSRSPCRERRRSASRSREHGGGRGNRGRGYGGGVYTGIRHVRGASEGRGEGRKRPEEVCRDFQRGQCPRNNCRYAHEGNVEQITRIEACGDFLAGMCYRNNCRFAHASNRGGRRCDSGGGGDSSAQGGGASCCGSGNSGGVGPYRLDLGREGGSNVIGSGFGLRAVVVGDGGRTRLGSRSLVEYIGGGSSSRGDATEKLETDRYAKYRHPRIRGARP